MIVTDPIDKEFCRQQDKVQQLQLQQPKGAGNQPPVQAQKPEQMGATSPQRRPIPHFKIEYYSEMCRYLSVLSNKSLFPKNFSKSSKFEWIDYEISILIMKNMRFFYQQIDTKLDNINLQDYLQYKHSPDFEVLSNLFYLRVPFIS